MNFRRIKLGRERAVGDVLKIAYFWGFRRTGGVV